MVTALLHLKNNNCVTRSKSFLETSATLQHITESDCTGLRNFENQSIPRDAQIIDFTPSFSTAPYRISMIY